MALAALLSGCDRQPTASTTSGSPSASTSTSSTTVASHGDDAPSSAPRAPRAPRAALLSAKLTSGLRDAAVSDVSYARRELFSWTTRAQAERLRRDKKLLLDTELPSGPTPYVELLGATAAGDGPYADVARLLLLHPSLRLRRYAWSRPWPTRLGVGAHGVQGSDASAHDYGDQLIRVVLAPNALIARFDPNQPDIFTFHDLDERSVPIAQALADPSRIAAVFHVRTDAKTPISHREYVLCNEAMVTEWSLATPATRNAIREDIALLSALKDVAVAMLPETPARPFWLAASSRAADGSDTTDDPAALFAAALAFDSAGYRSSATNLEALVSALRRVETVDPPLSITPSAKFASDAVVPKIKLRIPPVRVARVA